ncbi:MAG: DUF86 domain-containing protein [Deltaproteobacteria bacterium]|nr:DUF86 domain-containing protein [Deltaproteobacteria bacterium]
MKMLQNTDREVYIKDQILRRAIDKSLNDIILATVDIAANFLKIKKRVTPKTYKEIILATHEFVGDMSYKIALLVRCRNEAIHGYLKINWENVKVIKNAKDDILCYVNKIVALAKK